MLGGLSICDVYCKYRRTKLSVKFTLEIIRVIKEKCYLMKPQIHHLVVTFVRTGVGGPPQ